MKRILAGMMAGLLLVLAACGGSGAAARRTEESDTADFPALAVAETPTPSPEPSSEPVPTSASSPELRGIEPPDSELVCVTDWIPELIVELRYASPDNFTGQTIYDFSDAWLRYGTVKKLRKAQKALAAEGCGLKIWDAYRPAEAQFRLWEAVPDGRYVANPYTGHSSHANGGTVDLTLVRPDGSPVEMPTGFDDFSPLADRDYSDVSETAGRNAWLLERTMEEAGFVPYAGEWWHFSDAEPYPYEDLERLPFPLDRQTVFEPDCEETLSLLAAPEAGAEVLALIARGTSFSVLSWAGDYARIQVQDWQGYVPVSGIRVKTP